MFFYSNKNNLLQSHTMAVLKLFSYSKVRQGLRLHYSFISSIYSICSSVRTNSALWAPKKLIPFQPALLVHGLQWHIYHIALSLPLYVPQVPSISLKTELAISCSPSSLGVSGLMNDTSISFVNQNRNWAVIFEWQR